MINIKAILTLRLLPQPADGAPNSHSTRSAVKIRKEKKIKTVI